LLWNYKSEAAKSAVSYLTGVKSVTNHIKIKSESLDTIEKEEVEKTIARSLSINENKIDLAVAGTTITLTGTVNSWHQKEEAGCIAWITSGIWNVNNELIIEKKYLL
jgi:osmotically-inducible protein OsmY